MGIGKGTGDKEPVVRRSTLKDDQSTGTHSHRRQPLRSTHGRAGPGWAGLEVWICNSGPWQEMLETKYGGWGCHRPTMLSHERAAIISVGPSRSGLAPQFPWPASELFTLTVKARAR